MYKVTVRTGDKTGAGTDAKVKSFAFRFVYLQVKHAKKTLRM